MERRFHCQQCGSCCQTSGWVYVTESEAKDIATFLDLNVIEFYKNYVIHDRGWLVLSSPDFHPECFLSEDGRCSIYPVRPQTCRTYPLEFNSIAEYKKAITVCPELKRIIQQNGQGQLVNQQRNTGHSRTMKKRDIL